MFSLTFWLVVAVGAVLVFGWKIISEASFPKEDLAGKQLPGADDSRAEPFQSWEPVAEASNGADIHLIAGLLEEEGIPTEAEEEYVHSHYWDFGTGSNDSKLSVFVPGDRVGQAREILSESPYRSSLVD